MRCPIPQTDFSTEEEIDQYELDCYNSEVYVWSEYFKMYKRQDWYHSLNADKNPRSGNGMPFGGYDRNGILCCDRYGSPVMFPSIVHACWWGIVTLTSVGYGDIYPVTQQGRVIGICTSLIGVLIIAVPLAIVASKLHEVYDDFNRREKQI